MLLFHRVANHMGNQRYGDWNNFTFFSPFNQAQYYHPYCLITNFNNQTEARILHNFFTILSFLLIGKFIMLGPSYSEIAVSYTTILIS